MSKLSIEEQILIIQTILFPEQKAKKDGGPYSYIAESTEEK